MLTENIDKAKTFKKSGGKKLSGTTHFIYDLRDLRIFKYVFISMFSGASAFMGDILSIDFDCIAFTIFVPVSGPGLVQTAGFSCKIMRTNIYF